MKNQYNKRFVLIIFAASLLFAGCVGTGPSTQQGAVAGGALGAIVGAIAGNNSRGGNALGGALIGGTVGSIVGGTIGNTIDHDNGTIYTSPDMAVRCVYYGDNTPLPPAPFVETVAPAPGPNFIWIGGYWSWNGGQYIWVNGQWAFPPIGCFYIRPHWELREGTHYFVRGYWRRR